MKDAPASPTSFSSTVSPVLSDKSPGAGDTSQCANQVTKTFSLLKFQKSLTPKNLLGIPEIAQTFKNCLVAILHEGKDKKGIKLLKKEENADGKSKKRREHQRKRAAQTGKVQS